MEGLIPMVYRSLKKSKTRRRYECLSTGAAQAYNIADFYIEPDHDQFSRKQYGTPEPQKVPVSQGPHHRRYNSMHVDHTHGFGSAEDAADSRQLVRFRSHRLFSCVTGA